jgi:hypothetical protein
MPESNLEVAEVLTTDQSQDYRRKIAVFLKQFFEVGWKILT